jgi:hypothetical protein
MDLLRRSRRVSTRGTGQADGHLLQKIIRFSYISYFNSQIIHSICINVSQMYHFSPQFGKDTQGKTWCFGDSNQ